MNINEFPYLVMPHIHHLLILAQIMIQVMTHPHLRAMTVVVDHLTVVVMVTNYFFYAFHFYSISECSRVGVSFCKSEYLRAENPTHEHVLIRALGYECRL